MNIFYKKLSIVLYCIVLYCNTYSNTMESFWSKIFHSKQSIIIPIYIHVLFFYYVIWIYWFSEFGEDDPDKLKDAVRRFTHSCAGYTVASYVLVSKSTNEWSIKYDSKQIFRVLEIVITTMLWLHHQETCFILTLDTF